MAISLQIANLEEVFHKSTTDPIIVNNFDVSLEEEKKRLNRLIYTRYEGNTLELVPSCACGHTKTEFYINMTCEVCGTTVMSVTERPVESVLWLMPPKGVETFFNPQVWFILSDALTYGGINLLEWLCNPNMAMPAQVPEEARRLRGLGLERGINVVYQRWDEYVQILFKHKLWGKTQAKQYIMLDFIQQNRRAIFTRYLPVPSKLTFVTEQRGRRTSFDTSMTDAIEAVRTISAVEFSQVPQSLKTRQARAVDAIVQMSRYHQEFFENNVGGKPGLARKHVFGGRLHYSFRGVISSLSDNHHYAELHMPWSMSVMVYQTHLEAKMMQRGMSPQEMITHLREHTLQYSPLLDELFTELIAESPYTLGQIDPTGRSPDRPGLPVLFNRNPTLVRGSIQHLLVTKIKSGTPEHRDISDNTISMSVLSLKAPNADFDGRMLPSLNLSNCWNISKVA